MRRRKKQNAFSLIELMVAMFIFLTCLMFIFGVFPTAVKAVNQGRYTFLATQVAQKELEHLRNLPWEKLDNFSSYVASEPGTFYRNTTLTTYINGVESTVKFESVPVVSTFSTDANGNTEVVTIRVLVKYAFGTEADGYKSVEVETLVSRP